MKKNKITIEKLKKEGIEPIITMDEKTSMPLYMFIGDMTCPWLKNMHMNIMLVAMHKKEEKRIQVKGRMRYEETGRKTIFEMIEIFQENELLLAKSKIQEMYNTMCKEMKLEEMHKPLEMEFMINETIESIMQKMKETDAFNMEKIEKQ